MTTNQTNTMITNQRLCRHTAAHNPHTYSVKGAAVTCPGIACDHSRSCCREHGTHSTPHTGWVLR